MPVFESEFVGRREELETILMALEIYSLVSIVGPGGMGKTCLAAQIARARGGDLQRDMAFVALAGIYTREAFISTLLSALHIQVDLSQDDIIHYAAQFLMGQPVLLILDGVDQLLEHGDVFYQLAQFAGTKLLLTTRTRTGLPNEFVLDLHGLPYTRNANPPHTLPAAEQLFVQCVRQINASFEPSADELVHIQRICQMTEGMPLAIELAASWVRLLPIKFIASQISQNLDWLTSSLAVSRNAQHSIRIILDDFWQSLSPEEQQQLCQLSVFQEGFEREMAKTLAGTSLFFLSALAQRTFLVRHTSGRYYLHELLRQFANEHLATSPYDFQTRLGHAELMRDLSQRAKAAFAGPQRDVWLERMQTELGNVRAAITWSLAQQQMPLALEMLINLEAMWDSLVDISEVCMWLESALQDNLPPSKTTQPQPLRTQATKLYRRYTQRQSAK